MKQTGEKIVFFITLLVFYFFIPVHETRGQKVALVLSGGGSRGAAHIGVIRALEEQHIPIDYIVGTSIGAIIGSLYSIGYTPDEMEALMLSDDFQRWLSGTIEDKYVFYYRKEDANSSWVSLDFNFKKKLTSQLPTNFISPYNMDFAVLDLYSAAGAACNYNFDQLMIPFRCVVADVDSTQPLVLRKGDLNGAVRGSMTLPFIFKPITINGKLVFDGGMYNNFPVDVAHNDFHPDVIIGSKVAERYSKPDRDDILEQIQTMLMNRQIDSIPYKNSVMVTPNIRKISILNFGRTVEVEDSGYVAAMRKIAVIRKLVQDTVTAGELARKRSAFRGKMIPVFIDSIHITGMNKIQSEYLVKELKQGKRLVTMSQLKKAYFQSLDEGTMKNIFPFARLNQKTGYYDLFLDIQKSDNFNIQFGGNMSMGASSQGFLELQYKYLWKTALRFMLNGYFGRFYNSVKGGARIDFNSWHPLSLDLYYTYNHFDFFRNSTYFFDDKTPSYVLQSESFGEFALSIPATNKGKISLGSIACYTKNSFYQNNSFSRTDTADQTVFEFISPKFGFELNNLNRKQYASAGARFAILFSYVNGMEREMPGSTSVKRDTVTFHREWFNLKLVWDNYFKTIGPVKIGIYLEGNISSHPLFGNYTATLLYMPAFQPLPEMQARFIPSYRSSIYGAAGLKGIVTIFKKLEFRLEGYLFQPYQEVIHDPVTQEVYSGPILSNRSLLGSAVIVYNSFLGPLSLGVNFYDKQADSYSLNLNFGYILFNHRALP